MITERELRDAIEECYEQRNPNADTCKKLASYYIILDKLTEKPSYSYSAESATINSGSEFSDIIHGKDMVGVLVIMDELMETVRVLAPKLYRATIDRLNGV